jgi:hypothetical protein
VIDALTGRKPFTRWSRTWRLWAAPKLDLALVRLISPRQTEICTRGSHVRPERLQHDGRARSPHDGRAGFDVVVLDPVRGADCSGHMGATPQPNQTVTSDSSQRRRFRKSGLSNVIGSNQHSGESIDTVGVTGSIPVSPTNGGPRNTGPPIISGSSRAALAPRERWLRWLFTAGCGPDVARRPRPQWRRGLSARNLIPGQSATDASQRDPCGLWTVRSPLATSEHCTEYFVLTCVRVGEPGRIVASRA